MNPIEIATLDLNLLVVLALLLEERNLTTAGRRLGRTPSAMSHALGRLRVLFGDPLFVRVGHGLRPTPAAEALRAPLDQALAGIADVLRPAAFDPATARRRFHIIASEYLQLAVLPDLMPHLRREAPGLDLVVRPVPADLEAALATDTDLAFGVGFSAPESLRRRHLGSDRFVCVRAAPWPAELDPTTWAALPHVLVSPGERPGGPVDDALAALGLRRRIALRLPGFRAALEIVAQTDLATTLPERLVHTQAPAGLHTCPPPLDLPSIELVALWHPRVDADPGHRWLRSRLPSGPRLAGGDAAR